MSNHIGTSVGVWNSGNKVYPNSEYSNFARNRFNVGNSTWGKPFYTSSLNFKQVYQSLGIQWKEYSNRKKLVTKYAEQGVTVPQINSFYEKFKTRGGGTLEQFDSFIADQRLIADAQAKEEAELLARLKEEEKKKAISDSNLFPPDETELNPIDPLTDDELKSNYNTKPIVTPKKNNLLIYGVIGVVALVGIIILVKRK